jgi:ribosomal protein S7
MIRLKKRILKSKKSNILLFVNRFMRAGKRDFLYKSFLLVLIRVKRFLKKPFSFILNQLLERIRPVVQLKPKFVSGIIYMLPAFINENKSKVLAFSWLVKAIKTRPEDDFRDRLLFEIYDIFENRGYTLRFRRDYYKLCLTNRALLFKFRNK